MNRRTISVVAMSNRDFPDLEEKFVEAAHWVRVARDEGAELVVFPEVINRYCGDGPGNPLALPREVEALSNWPEQSKTLVNAAKECGVDLILPVTHLEAGGRLFNSFFLISVGEPVGRYDKLQLTPGELAAGVVPGSPGIIDWRGIKLGGAICFDTNFERIFRCQVVLGAQMFIIPSLWPGGSLLPALAVKYVTPMALAYPAWSRIIDITGEDLVAGGYRLETLRFGFGAPVYTATLNFNRVALHADRNAVHMDEIQQRFGSRVRIHFQQTDSRFILESVSADLDVKEIIEAYHLIDVRDYLGGLAWSDVA